MNFEAIPHELRDKSQWICWRYETRDDGKPTKPPINPRTGDYASSTDPKTWTTFEIALRSAECRRLPGVGYVFTEEDGIAGIDLDHCRNRETGGIAPWAKEIITAMNSYSEISPSEDGLHIWFRAKLPPTAKHVQAMPGGKIEIYDRKRFFTVTGNHLAGTPLTIELRQIELETLHKRLFPPANNGSGSGLHGLVSLSDRELIDKAMSAENGHKFSRLWNGDISDYDNDDSRADQALCNLLAFWTGKDAARMDALFRQSGLYRDKWDRTDYRERTINAAIERTINTFDPGRAGRLSGHDPDRGGDHHDGEGQEVRPTRYSDDALADLFSTEYKDQFRYVDEWGWLQWTGMRWQRVPDVVVMGYARQVCRQQSDLCKSGPDLSPKVQLSLARAVASAKTVAAVVKLASSDKRHYAEVAQFDADLWAFNTPAGTVDLRSTGTLRSHRREDYITKIGNAAPEGNCPKWLAFLHRVTDGNVELQSYLQRLAGYAMVGDPSEECLDFFYGQGGNGKGTLLKTLQYIFGEYGTTAATETFLEAKGETSPHRCG